MNQYLKSFAVIAAFMISFASAAPANAFWHDNAFVTSALALKDKAVEAYNGPEWHVDSRADHWTVHVQIPSCENFDDIPVMPTEYVKVIMDAKRGRSMVGINIGAERGKVFKAEDGPSILLAIPGIIQEGSMGLRRSDKEEIMDVVIDRMIDAAEIFCQELVDLPNFVLVHDTAQAGVRFVPKGSNAKGQETPREIVADFTTMEPQAVVDEVFAWEAPTGTAAAPKRAPQQHVDPIPVPAKPVAAKPVAKPAAKK